MDVNLIDLYTGGHHRSYLEMLVSYWLDYIREGVLRIFVTTEFLDTHADFLASRDGSVEVLALDIGEVPPGGVASMSMLQLDRIHARALKHVSSTYDGPVVLMYFDPAQLAMARYTGRRGAISGLFFRSPFNERESGRMSRVRAMRKDVVLKRALRNRGLFRLFCLDPRDVAGANRIAGRDVAVALPDGVKLGAPSMTRNAQRKALRVEESDRVFLLFGVICRRKGILELAAAIKEMDSSARRRMILVVAGRKLESDRKLVVEALGAISDRVRLIDFDGRVSDEAMESLFTASDVVLVPYTSQHVGSSGVLIRAAIRGRPVIGPDTGLLAMHIKDHHLGQTVDTRAVRELAQVLQVAVEDPLTEFDEAAARAFGMANSDVRFAEAVFSELGCTAT